MVFTIKEVIEYLENINVSLLENYNNMFKFQFPKRIGYINTTYELNYIKSPTDRGICLNPYHASSTHYFYYYCQEFEYNPETIIKIDFSLLFNPKLIITKKYENYDLDVKIKNLNNKLINVLFSILQKENKDELNIMIDYVKDNILEFNL